MEKDGAGILEQKLKKLFGSDISYRERKAINLTLELYKKKPYFESFSAAVKSDSFIRRAIGHKKKEFMDILKNYGKKVEAISINSDEKSDHFNFKEYLEESDEEDVRDYRRRRRRRRQRSTSIDSPEKRVKYEKRYERKSLGAPSRSKIFSSRNPGFAHRDKNSFMEKAFSLYSVGLNTGNNPKKMSPQETKKTPVVLENLSVKTTPFKGAIPPPPPSAARKLKPNPQKRDKLARFQNRKDCIIVKNIPHYYNVLNYLIKYFQRFGEIVNISTFLDLKASVVQYKQESGAQKAMTSPTIPFNLSKIELHCDGEKKETPKVPAPETRHSQRRGSQHQSQGYNQRSPFPQYQKKEVGYKATLEEKKRNWKLLQENKTLILARLTTFVQLYLELKRTKTTPEQKLVVQNKIRETHAKMVRVNQCKDIEVLRNEFPDAGNTPLNITLNITSKTPLEYSYLSNLLSTYGRLEKLVIDESAKEAKIKFFSIGDAFKAYHDFIKKEDTFLEFEDSNLQGIVTEKRE